MTSSPPSLTDRLKELANVIAPVTLVTGLLVYFGYIGTRARLEYFGVYLDMTGLSTQDLVLSGLEVVYVPTALAFLAVLVVAALHAGISWLLERTGRDTSTLIVAAVLATLGLLMLGRALVGVFSVPVARAEVPGTTPLTLAIGPCLLAYGIWIGIRVLRRGRSGDRLERWFEQPQVIRLRRAALVGVGGLLVVGLFWAANSFASGFGAGLAYDDATLLPRRPEVVLDLRDPITDPPPGIVETRLPDTDPNAPRYRYRGLRLLVEAGGRLYLVPAYWTAQSRTVVIPYADAARIQLIP